MGLTPELQRYYEDRLAMMSEKAWKDLMEDVDAMLQATNDLSAVQDEKTLHFRRGEISIMRWMLSLKETSEKAYEELVNETTD
jgi:hypothetical protein